jgi:hypothetical protein
MKAAARTRTPNLPFAPPSQSAPSVAALEEGDAVSVEAAEAKSLVSKAAVDSQTGRDRRQYSLFEMVVLFSLFILSGPLLIL